MSKKPHKHAQFPRRFGNYHLLAPLAQGGMGALYLAVRGDRGLERLLVIKTVLPHLADAEYLARFRDEAKVVVKLSHGNLIPVFDAGTVGGEVYLAMEFLEGRDLRAVWNRCAKKQVAFPVDVAVYVVKELCRGLAYAHSFGGLELVHRDVSPPNILISFSGEVKLTDFGLASSTLKLEKTAPGIIYGKVAYMSPEQARGEALDARSDMYAAAIVLWEMLTGRQLFPPGKDQPQDLIKRARNPRVPAPSARAPRVPHDLDEICLKALAPRAADRYQDCEEFRAALSSWLADKHPGTDASRLEAFLHRLFAEDIERERDEREQLLARIRNRVQTRPPSDELRRAFEHPRPGSEDAIARRVPDPAETPTTDAALAIAPDTVDTQIRRESGSLGRRATDHGDLPSDRRQVADRRKRLGTGRPLLTQPGHGPMRAPSEPGSARALAEADKPLDVQALLGQVIDGRYRIERLIGEGGMGRVYLAEHVEIGRRVAMKILHPVYSHMPDLVERFRREARAASRIGHPHIVDVTDSGRTREGSVYFVMEYLEGVDLGTVIEREGSLDIRRSLRIGNQICRALAAAHDAGIIHRDLKPDNIYLTLREGGSDFVKVLDFGIAKSSESERAWNRRLTSPGIAMGTPEYMAPEQAAGKPASERCDIYAVGAILYEALTGVPPYSGDNFMEVLTKKATSEPTPIDQLRPEVPDSVITVIERAMARDPEQRPASMEVFAYELTKCIEGRGQAVADILGMNIASDVVASLDPRRALPPARVSTTPPPSDSAWHLPTPSPDDPESDSIDLDIAEAMLVAPPAQGERRAEADQNTVLTPMRLASRWGLLGLIGAAALLIVAAGVILYFASGDDPSPRRAVAAENSNDDDGLVIEDDDSDDPVAAAPPDAAAAVAARVPATPIDAGSARVRPPPGDQTPPPASAGMTQAQARALLKRARAQHLDAPQQAITLYKQVAGEYRPYRQRAYLGIAEVEFQRKRWDSAISYASRAGGIDADRILGDAYYRKKDLTRARQHYRAMLERDPDNRHATAMLARLGP
ncbi:protein kinase domain-containing protein [Haliangium sp.]|uniref:protein kinase domain-containing protein n=1 Tax=Haliangium sp. TaxID=2663208 RepID=UPI003D103EE5